jgi:DNA primase
MSLYIDHQYIAQISSRLERFKRKNQRLYNFRCPFCGDSEKSKIKARGYFYQNKNEMFFRCHNCNESMSVGTFLKKLDHKTYEEYIFDRYKAGENGHSNYKKPEFKFKWNKPPTSGVDEKAEVPKRLVLHDAYSSIADLPSDHAARMYVLGRQIPEEFLSEIFYVPDFKKLIDSVEPDNEYELKSGDTRIVIPFYNESREVIALQGRSLSAKAKLRYITIKIDKNAPKVFGLDRVDETERVYVVEGPIDSMFLPNCIATAGAALDIKTLSRFDDVVFVYDNERRNKAIVNAMVHVADESEKVCVWPTTLKEKDINDMILAGRTPDQIKELIDTNTYDGLNARIAISEWRRC